MNLANVNLKLLQQKKLHIGKTSSGMHIIFKKTAINHATKRFIYIMHQIKCENYQGYLKY